jgi:isopentenyl-diphosphate delta-isomerase
MQDAAPETTRTVVVCDEQGTPLGTAGVIEAHQGAGILHRAFSAFVFRRDGAELLVQQRSARKRLFPLRWANTCCSHPPAADQLLVGAAERRLREEFGFSVALRAGGSFVYRASDADERMSEYEYDTVLVGQADEWITPRPDAAEIAAWRWMVVTELERDLRQRAAVYAPWLPEALQLALAALRAR